MTTTVVVRKDPADRRRVVSKMRTSALILVVFVSVVCPAVSFVRSPTGLPSGHCSKADTASARVTRRCATPGGGGAARTSVLAGTALRSPTRGAGARERASARITNRNTALWAEEEGSNGVPEPTTAGAAEVAVEKSGLPFYLDPSTRGGAVVVPTLSLLLPLGAYGTLIATGVDSNKAGVWVGVGYTMIGLIAWVGSYFFRVATKNMTYAVQLKNYEQAVIEKRFSELEEEEVDALLDEVNEP